MKITPDWFVDTGFLVSEGFWGEKKILVAGRYFPGKELKIFMTGDAHHKPFRWATRGVWPNYFRELIHNNKICCHVESYSHKVTVYSVPEAFRRVFSNNKVFGWEPNVFEIMHEICSYIHTPERITTSVMRYLICRMHLVSAQGYLDIEYRNAQKLWRLHSNYMLVDFYNEVLQKYYDKVYTLRVDPRVQSAIGDKIQKNINKYQDHVHLITCGSEHISKNPLYNYINAPVGCFGIADESSDMPGAEIRRVKPWKLLIRKVFRGFNS